MTIEDAVHRSLRAFCPCPECGGGGMVFHQYFNNQTQQEDGDWDLCGECHGSGTTAWEADPGPVNNL